MSVRVRHNHRLEIFVDPDKIRKCARRGSNPEGVTRLQRTPMEPKSTAFADFATCAKQTSQKRESLSNARFWLVLFFGGDRAVSRIIPDLLFRVILTFLRLPISVLTVKEQPAIMQAAMDVKRALPFWKTFATQNSWDC